MEVSVLNRKGEETGKKVTGNPYRSPKLYTFDEEAYASAKKIGMRLEF